MLPNYFLIAWRNFTQSQSYSFISIGRMAIILGAYLFISLWIHDELTQADKNDHPITQIAQDNWFNGRKEIGSQLNTAVLDTQLCNTPKDNFIPVALLSQKANYISINVDKKLRQSTHITKANIQPYFTMDLLFQGNVLCLRQW